MIIIPDKACKIGKWRIIQMKIIHDNDLTKQTELGRWRIILVKLLLIMVNGVSSQNK